MIHNKDLGKVRTRKEKKKSAKFVFLGLFCPMLALYCCLLLDPSK